jgi:hypothetical protein
MEGLYRRLYELQYVDQVPLPGPGHSGAAGGNANGREPG